MTAATCPAADAQQYSRVVGHSPLDWLLLHYRVKLEERRGVVAGLDLGHGDEILDLGCGPGLWTQLIADAVGPRSRIVGGDINDEFLDFARRSAAGSHPDHDLTFVRGAFEALPEAIGRFDVVFFSQCFCYVEDVDRLMQKLIRRLKPGDRIIARNWDSGLVLLHPVDEVLFSRVQTGMARTLAETRQDVFLDNYFGRKMPGIFRRNGLRDIACKTDAFSKWGPAPPDLATYVATNGLWMGEMARPHLDPAEFDTWMKTVDPTSSTNIFGRDDFYFAVLDVTVSGHV